MWLTVLSGPDAGSSSEVSDTEATIGRDEGCEIVLTDPQVSRRHALVKPLGDGRFELSDLGSSNGTYLDGRRVDVPTVLEGTQQIQVGDTVLAAAASQEPDSGGTVLGARRQTRITRRPSGSYSAIQRAIATQEKSVRRALLIGGGALVLALVVVVLLVTGVVGGGKDMQAKVEDAVKKVTPSTALVQVTRGGEPAGTGSGWVLDAAGGLIVTNAHVVNGGDGFQVSVAGRTQQAKVVAVAPCEDLAVLRVPSGAGMRALPILGSQSQLEQGQTVVAVGFPQSASPDAHLTSTNGIVSVVRLAFKEQALDVPQYPNVIQTDVPINPGNSGGPLVDLNGRLVGVNSAGRTSAGGRAIQGQGFAIGTDRIHQIVPQLQAGHSIGWTGMEFDYPSAASLGKEGLPAGLLVSRVIPGSPAERAGFGKDPILVTAIAGKPLDNTLSGYCNAVRGIRSGQQVPFTIVRGQNPKRETVKVRFA